MKRRDFLKSGAIIGGTAAAIPTLTSCDSDKPDKGSGEFIKLEVPEESLIDTIENEFLRIKLFSTARMEILDKTTGNEFATGRVAIQENGPVEEGHVWLRTDRSMCEQYPGRFLLTKKGEEYYVRVYSRQDQLKGDFSFSLSAENEWMKIRVYNIGETLESLVFPPPVESENLVLPKGIGQLSSGTESRMIYTRHAYTFFTHLNMRWFGGLKKDTAWMCIYEKGFEDSIAMVANNTVSPGFTRTLGEWKHEYQMKYCFMKGNYVQLAKKYRQHMMDTGEFKSLAEKAKKNPNVREFYGGRAFWFTLASGVPRERDTEDFLLTDEQKARRGHGRVNIRCTFREAVEVMKKIEGMGMKKGFFKIAGWINRGYDWSHPDVWPPEPELGSVEELKKLMEWKGKAITGLHDNYMDMYEGLASWPDGVVRQKDGSLMTGGGWGGGQAYILTYKAGLEYAKRNWENIKQLMPKAMFIDTTTAMQLYQSYEKGNESTKADDLHYKREIIRFFVNQGVLFGSEEVADFAIPDIHWFETRHSRVEGETIPLWPLVFHDAAILTRYGGAGDEDSYPKWLEDMLWGYMMHFHVRNKGVDESYFKESLHVDDWHGEIAEAEMTDHKFLTEDKKVEQTFFSNGKSIICNFGKKDVRIKGKMIRAENYLIV